MRCRGPTCWLWAILAVALILSYGEPRWCLGPDWRGTISWLVSYASRLGRAGVTGHGDEPGHQRRDDGGDERGTGLHTRKADPGHLHRGPSRCRYSSCSRRTASNCTVKSFSTWTTRSRGRRGRRLNRHGGRQHARQGQRRDRHHPWPATSSPTCCSTSAWSAPAPAWADVVTPSVQGQGNGYVCRTHVAAGGEFINEVILDGTSAVIQIGGRAGRRVKPAPRGGRRVQGEDERHRAEDAHGRRRLQLLAQVGQLQFHGSAVGPCATRSSTPTPAEEFRRP